MSTSLSLGETKEVRLPQGTLRYRERGSGRAIVFIHGLLVNGDLWRKVVPALAANHRCIVPDLPLGSHELALDPNADLTVPGLARLIADFLEALDLEDVVLVANDTGGALSQITVTEYPERVGALVLTSCDAFDNFLPALFAPLLALARFPSVLGLIGRALKFRPLRRLPLAFGWLAKRPIDDTVADAYLRPIVDDLGVRRDCAKVMRSIHPKYTLRAAEKLGTFEAPVLLAWAREDRFFPVTDAERLAGLFPNATLELIDDCYTFVSEDQPERLVEVMRPFLDRLRPANAAPRAAG